MVHEVPPPPPCVHLCYKVTQSVENVMESIKRLLLNYDMIISRRGGNSSVFRWYLSAHKQLIPKRHSWKQLYRQGSSSVSNPWWQCWSCRKGRRGSSCTLGGKSRQMRFVEPKPIHCQDSRCCLHNSQLKYFVTYCGMSTFLAFCISC